MKIGLTNVSIRSLKITKPLLLKGFAFINELVKQIQIFYGAPIIRMRGWPLDLNIPFINGGICCWPFPAKFLRL